MTPLTTKCNCHIPPLADEARIANASATTGGCALVGGGAALTVRDSATLRGCNASASGAAGGGAHVSGGSMLTLIDAASITDCTAPAGAGGALYAEGGSTVNLNDTTSLARNTAGGLGGGGAYVTGALTALHLAAGSLVRANAAGAASGVGGGLLLTDGADARVLGTLKSNTAHSGAGAAVVDATLEFAGAARVCGHATPDGGNGGGVSATGDAARISLHDTAMISGNTAGTGGAGGAFGGGAYAADGALIEVGGRAAIEGNTATYGGGAYATDEARLRLHGDAGASISRNVARDTGGGVYVLTRTRAVSPRLSGVN